MTGPLLTPLWFLGFAVTFIIEDNAKVQSEAREKSYNFFLNANSDP